MLFTNMVCLTVAHSYQSVSLTYFSELYLPAKIAPVLEHISRVRMQRPVRPLPGLVRGSGHLHKTVVETQRMADGVLPSLLVLSVEGEQVHDKLVNVTQSEHLAGRVLDRHGDEGDVGIGRLGVGVRPAVRLFACVFQGCHTRCRARNPTAHGTHGAHWRPGSGVAAVHGRGSATHARTESTMWNDAVVGMRHGRREARRRGTLHRSPHGPDGAHRANGTHGYRCDWSRHCRRAHGPHRTHPVPHCVGWGVGVVRHEIGAHTHGGHVVRRAGGRVVTRHGHRRG
jgi:hypothetical protein